MCPLAGGYVGYAMTTRWGGAEAASLQMIGFDMGGTSTGALGPPVPCSLRLRLPGAPLYLLLSLTRMPHSWRLPGPTNPTHTPADVSRYAGHFEHVFESTTAGVTIQAPQLDINTVAAGGGSRLFFRSGVFQVWGCGGWVVQPCTLAAGSCARRTAAAAAAQSLQPPPAGGP